MRVFFIGLLVFVGLTATAVRAEDFADDFSSPDESSSHGRWSFGVGLDYRLDDPEYHAYVPSECLRVYYGLGSLVQLRLGLSHNSLTRLSSLNSYHTVAADFGIKFRFDHRKVSPYLETGFYLPYYWGVDHGHEYDDYHAGLRFAVGLSVRFSPAVSVEMGVSQALNHVNGEYVAYSVIPPPGGGDFYFHRAPYGAYNEARLEAGVVVGL